MLNADELYDNAVQPDNVYGHCLALLDRYRSAAPLGAQGIHLELGCGFGRMAEVLRDVPGLTYVGVDGSDRGPSSLRGRGFEAHQLLFTSYDETLARLQEIVAGRPILSLSMLDTLEHLDNGDEVLRVIRNLIGQHQAPAVISVPNFAHRDVGFKLAFGSWDYTREGILDHTHLRVFNKATLKRTLNAVGLQIVDTKHVHQAKSDQHFPATHPALAQGSLISQFLNDLRDTADDTATVNQFVSLVLAGPQMRTAHYLSDAERAPKRPFMSVVMRTQGKRPHMMIEALTALAAQRDRDFELLVIGHKLARDQQLVVERQLEDSPKWMRDQTRLIRVDEGNRTRPLNVGFEQAKGEYIVILDDDDVPMAHWISTFRKLAEEKPGRVLRTIAARQDVDVVEVQGQSAVRALGGLNPYPAAFDLLQHMITNESPPVVLAFPHGAFHDLNLRFDETLTTTEDWDFLMRCVLVVGVHWAPEITAIYHWWKESVESSRTVHDQAEWDQNYHAIHRKMDAMQILLEPGMAKHLRYLKSRHDMGDVIKETGRTELLQAVVEILTSRSWRWSWVNRLPKYFKGKWDPDLTECMAMSDAELVNLLVLLRKSSSWRRTAIFRPKAKR